MTLDEKSKKKFRSPKAWQIIIAILLLVALVTGGFKVWQWVLVPSQAPVIGVSLDTAWHSRLGITSKTYETALTRVQARMVDIRPGGTSADRILNSIDALLLTGGGDVDPGLYGGDPATAQLVDRRRDDLELELIKGALQRDMPVLGICRGIQILNVAHGGTLRNLREIPELIEVHGVELDSLQAHAIEIVSGSLLAGCVGAGEKQVTSFHGQAVDGVGRDLQVVAVAPDGVIEALERKDRSFVVVLQWHPEILSLENPAELVIFEELVKQAQAYKLRQH